jgi:hypothetical protein
LGFSTLLPTRSAALESFFFLSGIEVFSLGMESLWK